MTARKGLGKKGVDRGRRGPGKGKNGSEECLVYIYKFVKENKSYINYYHIKY